MITLVSGGLGSVIGTLGAGWLYQVTVAAGQGGWAVFWGVHTFAIAGCFVLFAALYQGMAVRPDDGGPPPPPMLPPPPGPREPGR